MSKHKGVILAAGAGSRLSVQFDEPKPLVPVKGVPLIVRTINALSAAGVGEVGVVVGHQAGRIRAAVEAHGALSGIAVQCIENPRWREPNGLSLHAALEFTGQSPFILAMADHIFDARIVQHLLQLPPSRGVTLAVDLEPERVFDLADATKVRVGAAGQIEAIGKKLRRFNAIDCGLFRCGPEVYGALEQGFARKEWSVSAGMQVLAAQGLMRAMPIDGLYWQDVDTPAMLAEAERWLPRRTVAPAILPVASSAEVAVGGPAGE